MTDVNGAGAAAVERWWESLPDNFYRQSDGTTLDAKHPFKIRSTAAIDHVGRVCLGAMLSSGLARRALMPGWSRVERARMEFYYPFADQADVASVFADPPPRFQVDDRILRSRGSRLDGDMLRRELSFDSPFTPLHPDMAAVWQGLRHNRRAVTQYWTHRSGPRPTLIFIHGYFASPYWLNSRMFALPWLFGHGYDILLYTVPFHGARAQPSDPFSGYGFVAHGVAGINESMLQAIFELRILVGELLRRGAPSVGVSGLSLGGYLSALLACVDDRLAFCIPNSPLVVPTDMALEWLSLRWLLRFAMRMQGVNVRDMRRAQALHSPLSYQPRIEPHRLFIIGGAGDRFTPPRFVRLLHEHWKGSHLHWFPGNHLIHLHRGKYLRLMKWFMDHRTQPVKLATQKPQGPTRAG